MFTNLGSAIDATPERAYKTACEKLRAHESEHYNIKAAYHASYRKLEELNAAVNQAWRQLNDQAQTHN